MSGPEPRDFGTGGVFGRIAALPSPGTVGWVFRVGEVEASALVLRPGRVHTWKDARERGKVPGQPVLFLRPRSTVPLWLGWGRVMAPEERWRVLGVKVRCEEVVPGGLRALPESREGPSSRPAIDLGLAAHEWEYRELGHALRLTPHRERTPYLDNGARDLRLSAYDLRFLLDLQPGLRRFGERPDASGVTEGEA